MEDTNETGEGAAPPAALNATASAEPAPDVTERKVIGRPFVAGAPSANPGGRPKDTIARYVREQTVDGTEIVDFLIAVVRDDVDGRIGDKGGLLDRMDADASVLEQKAARMRQGDGGFAALANAAELAELDEKARDLHARAKALRSRLGRKRKIAVPVKTRHAAAVTLLERGWGKPLETVDLTLGNPDGTPIGSPEQPGALAHLTGDDMAKIGAVFEAASKRGEVVEAEGATVEGGAP